MWNTPTPYQNLPLAAKCAIEYLDAQADRTIIKLDAYLDHYFKSCGLVCDDHTRYSCHYIALKRFFLEGDAAAGNIVASYEACHPNI